VIGAALGSGANEIDDVTFTVSDDRQTELKSEAIADAVAKARADAASVAEAMDVAIVGPVEISTTGSQFSPYRMYMSYDAGYKGGGMMVTPEGMPVPMPTPAVAAPPQIQPGDVTVSAQVTVVYEFR
jgi:uncharacterized protein YggE